MQFKVGDTVICKKSLKGSDWEAPSGRKIVPGKTIPGNIYKITYADYWNENRTIVMYVIDDHWTLLSSKLNVSEISYQFEKYFYSKSEIRALKLNNLKKIP